ncbi:LytR/AlgR family response regulator transcription factor [Poritiphilus flavus]|uniref:Response regulator n=1 Tax=Poritiphilus flavus TaxID=2697053 RepID=A0A6L9EB66_9FLAO|nr:LytTR family DNA-binding domain-containing protein [Poritiphilus flavus]NAS11940.1 response regulator [Poritiphilus flavus]
MKCVIIDDEPLALGIIKSYCEELGNLEVMGLFTNPLESIEVLQKEQVDLVFLDIEMPQISGIEFVKSLEQRPMFIFTTAYPEYAIEGFELNAIDYLVKPIPFARFVKSINRAKEIYELRNTTKASNNYVTPAGGEAVQVQEFIFVKSDYDNVKIRLDSIKYIQGLKDYLKIHTYTNRPILTLMSFKDLEDKLPANHFMRVHRSFVVNVNNIDAVQKSKILIDDMRIPIGESYRKTFLKRIGL